MPSCDVEECPVCGEQLISCDCEFDDPAQVPFLLRLERVDHWERIASRRRPAFSSHLVNAQTVNVDSNGKPGRALFRLCDAI